MRFMLVEELSGSNDVTTTTESNGYLYHWSPSDKIYTEGFKYGDIGFHAGTREQALERMRNVLKGKSGGYLYTVQSLVNNPLKMFYDCMNWHAPMIACSFLLGENAGDDDILKPFLSGETDVDELSEERLNKLFIEYIDEFKSMVRNSKDKYMRTSGYDSNENKRMRQMIESKGFDGIEYVNLGEGDPSKKGTTVIAFYPDQLRVIGVEKI